MSEYIAKNKKAYFDYEILEEFETGIVLTGKEIKSIRGKQVNISGSYVKFLYNKKGQPELFAINININDSTRTRKLLMHKKQILYLFGKTEQKKLVLIPLKIYLKKNHIAKLLIGLAKGRKKYNKKELLKERQDKKEAQKELRSYKY